MSCHVMSGHVMSCQNVPDVSDHLWQHACLLVTPIHTLWTWNVKEYLGVDRAANMGESNTNSTSRACS